MDTSEMRGLLNGVVKIFKKGLQSKTWDIHGIPHSVTTTHCEGYDRCEAYALHIIEVLRVLTVETPSREVKKAFWIAWPTIVFQIEDDTSSESNKKVKWYSDCHNNLMDDIRLEEEKTSAKWDRHQKADEKLVQANLKITELEAKLVGLQKELAVLQKQDKRTPIIKVTHSTSLIQSQRPHLADPAGKGRRARPFPQPSVTGASSLMKPVCQYRLTSRCQWCQHQLQHQW